jgi:hypothetical protein
VDFCLEKGEVTDTFRTASIKLIPKKGDSTKLKNWRPISLLNCVYKIVSKCINERLKKVSNRILSRAQKGFTTGKYIQECLINVIETIDKCERQKIRALIVSLDQEKAFDSIRHDFMLEVFKFFEFPVYFMNLMEVFTLNRTARIIFKDGKLSQQIPLETGNAQGNAPSPLQFNFCEQIFIFKIELSNMLSSIHDVGNGLPNVFVKNPFKNFDENARSFYEYEQCRETDKLEGFADDANILTIASEENLNFIKGTLQEFALISGLKCNVEKSALMPIGFDDYDNLPDFLVQGGFPVVDKIKMLGITVTRSFEEITGNFDNTIQKLLSVRNFWGRFRLSLPGRLNICKSFMLSQIGYLQ